MARAGTAVDWIAQAAARDPSRIALEHAGASLTYAELMRRVGACASTLRARGVAPGDAVGVAIDRSPEAVVAALGIMAAGGCYVPLDPKQPQERQRLMIEQAGIRRVLSEADLRELENAPGALPELAGDRAAYMLFTSGSTGQPKGVVINMSSLSHFVAAATASYRVRADDRVLQFAPLHFDTSLEEIFLALANGATLVLRSDALLNSFTAFAAGVEAAGITFLDLPTAYWNGWVEALQAGLSRVPVCVRTIVLGGEAVHPETLRKWGAHATGARLVNSYGPTETTIVATTVDLTAEHAWWPALPIGRPLPGVRLLIQGPGGWPAETGELVILGPTVGAGYAGTEAALSVPLRVGSEVVAAYATGDRVMQRGGEIVFLGRLDDEVKISGHRVHPREVESQILRLPGVAEACVQGAADPSGRRRLVAFVAGDSSLAPAAVRSALQGALPAPFVPSVIKVMGLLPKTRSGKIDRAALVASLSGDLGPTVSSADLSLRERVKAVWREELGADDIDERSSFFGVGGQSLQAIRLSMRLSQALGRHVDVADVLQYPVLADFCARMSAASGDEAVRVVELGGSEAGAVAYLIPGIGGSSAQLADLARHLAHDRRVKVLEPRAVALSAVHDFARACAERIERDGTSRSLALVGHSFGGCVAYEAARVLEERGVAVDLYLLDSYLHLDRSDVGAAYRPGGGFGGRARLIYAEAPSRYAPDARAAARRLDAGLFTGSVDIQLSPGNHYSMLGGDHAAALARLMRWT
jgi:amino acid adenylation domain-containing protein